MPTPPIEVLVVDDDPGDVLMIEEALTANDVPSHLHVVSDGVEALAFLRREDPHADAPRPQLILLDLNMPRMDGWEFCATRLSKGELATIPVVTMSSPDNLATGPRPLVKPVARLQKPFDMSELLSTVWAAANSTASSSPGTP
jgi:CheY-like chemotaxis protein